MTHISSSSSVSPIIVDSSDLLNISSPSSSSSSSSSSSHPHSHHNSNTDTIRKTTQTTSSTNDDDENCFKKLLSFAFSIKTSLIAFFGLVAFIAWVVPLIVLSTATLSIVDSSVQQLSDEVSAATVISIQREVSRGIVDSLSLANWTYRFGNPRSNASVYYENQSGIVQQRLLSPVARRRSYLSKLTQILTNSADSAFSNTFQRYNDGSMSTIYDVTESVNFAQLCKSRNAYFTNYSLSTAQLAANLDDIYDCDILITNKSTAEQIPPPFPAYNIRVRLAYRTFWNGPIQRFVNARANAEALKKRQVNSNTTTTTTPTTIASAREKRAAGFVELNPIFLNNIEGLRNLIFFLVGHVTPFALSYPDDASNQLEAYTLTGFGAFLMRPLLFNALPESINDQARSFLVSSISSSSSSNQQQQQTQEETSFFPTVPVWSHGEAYSTVNITLPNGQGDFALSPPQNCYKAANALLMGCLYNVSDHPEYRLLRLFYRKVAAEYGHEFLEEKTGEEISALLFNRTFFIEDDENDSDGGDGTTYIALHRSLLSSSILSGTSLRNLDLFIPTDSFKREFYKTRTEVIIIIVFLLLFGVVATYLLVHAVTKKISLLAEAMYEDPFSSKVERLLKASFKKHQTVVQKKSGGSTSSSSPSSSNSLSTTTYPFTPSSSMDSSNNSINNSKQEHNSLSSSDEDEDNNNQKEKKGTSKIEGHIFGLFLVELFTLEASFFEFRQVINSLRSFMPQGTTQNNNSTVVKLMKDDEEDDLLKNTNGTMNSSSSTSGSGSPVMTNANNTTTSNNHIKSALKGSSSSTSPPATSSILKNGNSNSNNTNTNNSPVQSGGAVVSSSVGNNDNAADVDTSTGKRVKFDMTIGKNPPENGEDDENNNNSGADELKTPTGAYGKNDSGKNESNQNKKRKRKELTNQVAVAAPASRKNRSGKPKRISEQIQQQQENSSGTDTESDTDQNQQQQQQQPQQQPPSPQEQALVQTATYQTYRCLAAIITIDGTSLLWSNSSSSVSSAIPHHHHHHHRQRRSSSVLMKHHHQHHEKENNTSSETSSSSSAIMQSSSILPTAAAAASSMHPYHHQNQNENDNIRRNTYDNNNNDNNNNNNNNHLFPEEKLLKRSEFITHTIMKTVVQATGAHLVEYRADQFIIALRLSRRPQSKLAFRFIGKLIKAANEISAYHVKHGLVMTTTKKKKNDQEGNSSALQQQEVFNPAMLVCGLAIGDVRFLTMSSSSSSSTTANTHQNNDNNNKNAFDLFTASSTNNNKNNNHNSSRDFHSLAEASVNSDNGASSSSFIMNSSASINLEKHLALARPLTAFGRCFTEAVAIERELRKNITNASVSVAAVSSLSLSSQSSKTSASSFSELLKEKFFSLGDTDKYPLFDPADDEKDLKEEKNQQQEKEEEEQNDEKTKKEGHDTDDDDKSKEASNHDNNKQNNKDDEPSVVVNRDNGIHPKERELIEKIKRSPRSHSIGYSVVTCHEILSICSRMRRDIVLPSSLEYIPPPAFIVRRQNNKRMMTLDNNNNGDDNDENDADYDGVDDSGAFPVQVAEVLAARPIGFLRTKVSFDAPSSLTSSVNNSNSSNNNNNNSDTNNSNNSNTNNNNNNITERKTQEIIIVHPPHSQFSVTKNVDDREFSHWLETKRKHWSNMFAQQHLMQLKKTERKRLKKAAAATAAVEDFSPTN